MGTIRSFNEINTYDFSAKQFKAIKSEIEQKDKEYIIGVDEQAFKGYLFEKYKLEPIEIDFGSEQYDMPQIKNETRTDRFYGKEYEIEVYEFEIKYHFSGSAELFSIHPETWSMTATEIFVDSNRNIVSFPLTLEKKDPEQFKVQKSEIYSRAFANLDNANAFVQPYNISISQFIRTTFDDQKTKFKQENDFFAAINVKANRHTESIFTAPTIKKRIIPQPPAVGNNKEFSNQPTMAMKMYEDVLKVIYDAGKGMEQKPSLYKNKDEEGLRDQFLFILETRYEGTTASGETFNRSGKTDIILKFAEDGSNLFVAECKIWKGPAEFAKAISQLFDLYLTWRDSKAALMFFVHNKDFSNVVQQIQSEATKHPYFVRLNGNKGESTFGFIFNLPQDPNKSIYLEIMAFHYDK